MPASCYLYIKPDLLVKTMFHEIELFVVRWMDLESVIQSGASQKEKDKYRMLTHIYGIIKEKKKGHEEPRGKTGIKTQT